MTAALALCAVGCALAYVVAPVLRRRDRPCAASAALAVGVVLAVTGCGLSVAGYMEARAENEAARDVLDLPRA